MRITFNLGTLILHGSAEELALVAEHVTWDDRIHAYRAEARYYGTIALALHRAKIAFDDQARAFDKQPFQLVSPLHPRPHQQIAIQKWAENNHTGVVVLPTGSGKSLVARLAMQRVRRNTLITVPTLDLMHQWVEQLHAAFNQEIGMLGGGEHSLHPITVSTYDSAAIHMERYGCRFGLLICDECHHLPTPSTRLVATMCMAPFRLGLTATPERSDGGETTLYDLLGAQVHRVEIQHLEGEYLANYDLHQVPIILDDDEREVYDTAYHHYKQFAQINGCRLGSPGGWNNFIMLCTRSKEGREAFKAYHTQKRIARASRAKLRAVWHLLREHRGEQAILFTDDNATAYAIGETFFLPVITHKTRLAERKALLDHFRAGQIRHMVTSRVLNEGVDVPDVAVGIIVSGTGSVREHVQRLGRILRPRQGKQAVLYELVSEDTAETYTSARRRQHAAYQKEQGVLDPC
ncbi:type III restriction enzyme, res subunit [Magnetococcus marinus MC-1]|uniref:DNA 3'-5' helicase n=1 Tax=Magnetococcus marinus (strain ATCC BAA-1437 / JCM 17883 / MC-1) TaxID=156889 RepID=A0L5C7_MAGMM|nr:type III restriction enzyme, res subunit [Magnetococcus marinus MC-1]